MSTSFPPIASGTMKTLAAKALMLLTAAGMRLVACAQTGFAEAVPAGLTEEVLLSGTAINGYRLDLTRFSDPRPGSVLLAEIRRIWSQRAAPIQSVDQDGWSRLVQVDGNTIETFEVRPATAGSGTQGKRSRLRKDDRVPLPGDDWMQRALPAGSRVLNRIGHQDGERHMTTLVAVTSASSATAAQELTLALAQVGFRGPQRGSPSFEGEGRAMFLARGHEDLAVTVSEHAGQRAIVMHWGRAKR